MKLYIADQTSSQAVQIIMNELNLSSELIHFDVFGKSTSSFEDYAEINPLLYVPILVLDDDKKTRLSETTVITSYLADQHPETGLVPPRGSFERVQFDQLLVFIATEIAQKHIPMMRKLLTEEGIRWSSNKVVKAYSVLNQRLSDGRPFLTGEKMTVADAYLWATFWHERSGAKIEHLENLMAWKSRMDKLPSVRQALEEEAAVVALHKAQITARAA